jgi:hypothetical protein
MNEINFGFGQIFNAPPKWVIAVIVLCIIASTIAQFIIAGDAAIKPETQVRILLYLKGFEMFMLSVGAMVGVRPKKENQTE